MEIRTSRKSIAVAKNFLYDIVSGEGIDVDIFFPCGGVFIVFIYGIVYRFHLLAQIRLLFFRENFGTFVSDVHGITAAIDKFYLIGVVVVVDFEQPTSGDFVGICTVVILLCDVYTFVVDTYIFDEEIEPFIFVVYNHFYGFCFGSPGQTYFFTQFEGCGFGQVLAICTYVGEKYKMFAFVHSQWGGFASQFQTIWFFIFFPREVSASANLQWQLFCFAAYRFVVVEIECFEIIGSIEVFFFRHNGLVSFGVDKQYGKGA